MSEMIIRGDGVIGITILDDGTKIYWSDGYGDCQVIIKADGTKIVVQDPLDPPMEAKSIMEEQARVEGNTDKMTMMSSDINDEWYNIMK